MYGNYRRSNARARRNAAPLCRTNDPPVAWPRGGLVSTSSLVASPSGSEPCECNIWNAHSAGIRLVYYIVAAFMAKVYESPCTWFWKTEREPDLVSAHEKGIINMGPVPVLTDDETLNRTSYEK